MYKKNKILIIIGLILIFSLFGCDAKGQKNKVLLSYTEAETETSYKISYIKYDIEEKQKTTLCSDTKSSYPNAALSSNENILYFAQSDNTGNIDLVRYEISSKQETILTNLKLYNIVNADSFRINKDNSKIFMRVMQSNHRNFNLACYDIKNNKLAVFDCQETDLSIICFDYDYNNNYIYSVAYSCQDMFLSIDKANKEHKSIVPPKYILNVCDEANKKINSFQGENEMVESISVSHKSDCALLTISNLSEGKSYIKAYDLKSHSFSTLIDGSHAYAKIRQSHFSANGNGILFLGIKSGETSVKDKYGNYFQPSTLYYYDLKSKNTSVVLKLNYGVINNFSILH